MNPIESFKMLMNTPSVKAEIQQAIKDRHFGAWIRSSKPELYEEWEKTQ